VPNWACRNMTCPRCVRVTSRQWQLEEPTRYSDDERESEDHTDTYELLGDFMSINVNTPNYPDPFSCRQEYRAAKEIVLKLIIRAIHDGTTR